MVLAKYIWFVLALVLNSQTFYNYETINLGVVWCGVASYNERRNRLRVYRHLLTNRVFTAAKKLLTW